jgi:hypothetical protein
MDSILNRQMLPPQQLRIEKRAWNANRSSSPAVTQPNIAPPRVIQNTAETAGSEHRELTAITLASK